MNEPDYMVDDLIQQIREMRAQVRRSEEAIRVVADMIERAEAAWRDGMGHMPPTAFAPLQGWLRRDIVRIVRSYKIWPRHTP